MECIPPYKLIFGNTV